ncbi:uncharacterized protein K452DRAFT_96606 [Aplosporella prunicola CBS 121167]|uniref:Uncharacterized protein n=1 Tax=Aplosporella prunicola CBS 121167 TaxID=1176127 RepID=A0A6A6B2R8_9PEZI|nr:uncharacterized protein K452DRAFT_96606 [Aplosporella prunicola CBS 121167]KAF2137888.1 hypothetical protein K452DRAFT_96606 [Aplosporella prunicola CBS 121167]
METGSSFMPERLAEEKAMPLSASRFYGGAAPRSWIGRDASLDVRRVCVAVLGGSWVSEDEGAGVVESAFGDVERRYSSRLRVETTIVDRGNVANVCQPTTAPPSSSLIRARRGVATTLQAFSSTGFPIPAPKHARPSSTTLRGTVTPQACFSPLSNTITAEPPRPGRLYDGDAFPRYYGGRRQRRRRG